MLVPWSGIENKLVKLSYLHAKKYIKTSVSHHIWNLSKNVLITLYYNPIKYIKGNIDRNLHESNFRGIFNNLASYAQKKMRHI